MQIDQKLAILKEKLASLGRLALGFSGGVDSTFLMAVAYQVLGDRLMAVTAFSPLMPRRELDECINTARGMGADHRLVEIDPFIIPGFAENPPDRCYFCKRHIFSKIWDLANHEGIINLADGSNLDDLQDYRPGMRALQELEIMSPLLEAGLNKSDIRQLSRDMGLDAWDKPAAACLASRFPYGNAIDLEQLVRVEQAEDWLCEYGFRQVRVRVHQDLARIEVGRAERQRLADEKVMDEINGVLRDLGFRYVCLDMEGYRTGSMNIRNFGNIRPE